MDLSFESDNTGQWVELGDADGSFAIVVRATRSLADMSPWYIDQVRDSDGSGVHRRLGTISPWDHEDRDFFDLRVKVSLIEAWTGAVKDELEQQARNARLESICRELESRAVDIQKMATDHSKNGLISDKEIDNLTEALALLEKVDREVETILDDN